MTAKRRRNKTSKQTHSIAKRRKSKNDVPPARPLSSAEVSMLLQSPRKWTPRHLKVARLRLNDNALLTAIAEDYVPRDVYAGLPLFTRLYLRFFVWDRDHAFERAAAFFCQPSKESLVMSARIPDSNPFSRPFAHFAQILLRLNPSISLVGFSSFLESLMTAISGFAAGGEFFFYPEAIIRFKIRGLLSNGILRSHGAFTKINEGLTRSIPLIIFSCIDRSKTNDQETLAHHEIPQALLQAILAYSHNQQLKQYTGFVVTVDQTVLRVGRIVASQSYLRSLCTRNPLTDELFYYRSKPFELLERDDRREFLRVMLGVVRYLAESDASGMVTDQVFMY